MRRIVVSFSYSRQIEEASAQLASLAGQSEILVVGGSKGAADDFARACAARAGGVYGIHRMTMGGLAANLATEPAARRGLAPLSRLGLEALAARAVYACRSEGGLGYFEPVADTPGFPRALASTVTELRMQAVDRNALATAGAPGRDLARLLGVYERELKQRSLADRATIFRLASEVAGGGAHRLLGLPLFLLDCPLESAAERSFASALAARSRDVFATVLAGAPEGLRRLEQTLAAKAETLDSQPPSQTLDHVRQYLFAPQVPPAEPIDPSVEFFSAAGEGLECVEIARRILNRAAQGDAFDQMAILLRDPEKYLPLLEDALRRAAVPACFTRGTSRPDPAGRAFLALLDCAAQGLAASKFAEYLSLGQVPPPDRVPAPGWAAPDDELLAGLKVAPEMEEAEAEPEEDDRSPVISGTLRAPFRWEQLLVDAAVIGGRERWRRRLDGLAAEFRMRLAGIKEPDDPQRRRLEQQLELLANLQRFALPVIAFLDRLPKAARWGEWLERLRELAAMALRDPDSVLSVLSELEPMEEVGPVTLEEVRGALADPLSFLRREPPKRRYGHVFVGGIAEARAHCFQTVFLPGLAEGIFPRKAVEDPLLLDVYRAKLEPGLQRQDRRVAQERSLLRIAAGAARRELVVSYPRLDVSQGRPRVPSFYALEVWRAAEGRLPELREFERRAARGASSRLGWPAPADAGEAIDDAEYDLAFLEPIVRDPGQQTRGRARYLVQANAHLDRSLRTRYRRWRPSWSPADGIVNADDATLGILAGHRLSARSYSPTALQQYAACPYRFLLYAIHQLRPREDAVAIEQMDPLTRGALFHEIQFEIFQELQAAGLLPIAAGGLAPVMEIADRVVDRVAVRYQEDLAPAIPRVWRSEIEQIRIDARGWLLEVIAWPPDWQPAHFEWAFGLAEGAAEAVLDDGTRLRGRIDLIEKNRARGALRVTDHKTGKAPDRPPVWIGGGEILQPVLYGLAAERLLGEKVESGLLFYATQRGQYTRHEIALQQPARDRAAHVLGLINKAIVEGFLPAAPRREACQYCDYQMVCGPYEERRVNRKSQDELASLAEVRNIP